MDEAMWAETAGLQEVVGAPGVTKAEADRATHNAATRRGEEDWMQRAVKSSDDDEDYDHMKEEESPTYLVQETPYTEHAPSASATHDGATELM